MERKAVIMAGGSGTRLWPLSRRDRPKQLLRIIDGRSLIYRAVERLTGLLDPRDIYVITLKDHLPAIAEELPMLPPENLIGEPLGRDTAAAIALSAAMLHARQPETIMGVFTADHVIRPADRFVDIVRRGYDAAERYADALITFGVKPTEPHTGLGYVRRGRPAADGVYEVTAFKEKPDAATARQYVDSGEYFWNSGMFVWRTAAILDQLRLHLPETATAAAQLAQSGVAGLTSGTAHAIYAALPRISIDHAVMEKAAKVLTVEMSLEWLDVGNWTALPAVMGADASANTTAAPEHLVIDGKGNIIVSEDNHLIAVVGAEDLVVVHSKNATLVCRRDQVQEIKSLVARLEGMGKTDYL
ncbi:hypothetical protein B7486_06695 [cyanobacterium TDX16]|nr:hypothetical protein B7486_06695 [cyanobacterium TDX16]